MRMDVDTAILIAIVSVFLFVGMLKCHSTIGFCKRYFKDVPVSECLFSDRYKYDGD